jgi:hypothetical protein
MADSVEHALLLNEADAVPDIDQFKNVDAKGGEMTTITKTGSAAQQPLISKARQIKDEYVQKKLSL